MVIVWGEREVERRAVADRGLGADAAAVALTMRCTSREADAGAGELVLAVQALERGEQPVGVTHVEAGAVVAHEERSAPSRSRAVDLDARVAASW